jgi:hypothetical protein
LENWAFIFSKFTIASTDLPTLAHLLDDAQNNMTISIRHTHIEHIEGDISRYNNSALAIHGIAKENSIHTLLIKENSLEAFSFDYDIHDLHHSFPPLSFI